jgi:hypothetical protein
VREYSFVQSGTAIYRVFGHSHPRDSTLLLIRYYLDAGRWRKPPVYSAEGVDGATLSRYDVPRLTVAHYGISLGLGPVGEESYARYVDPLAPAAQERISELARLIPCPIGLSGSHLVGTARDGSDLDLVIYGQDGPESGALLLDSIATNRLEPVRPSVAFERFFEVTGRNVTLAAERNVYTGIAEWQGKTVKLDINYARSDSAVVHDTLAESTQLGALEFKDELVIEASGRYYFPGSITCRTVGRKERTVWILDHAAQYLLPGDVISGYGHLVSYQGREQAVICDLRSVEPRRS